MEAKVDIRKLQILNDRINQTIEALNQVRLTVHGLGHTSPFQPSPFQQNSPFGMSTGYGSPFGMGQQTQGLSTLGQQPFGFGMNPSFTSGWGLQHSNPWVNPYTLYNNNPMLSQTLGTVNPMYGGGSQFGLQGLYGQQGQGGLFHSNPDLFENKLLEVRANDPNRIQATFPYVWAPQSPLGIW